jgi:uncharacterized metal-binding protein YceD (DUF177 family)
MALDIFNIYTERLQNGHVQEIRETLSSDFLDVHENALSYTGTIEINGEAYLASDELIIHASLSAHCIIPCSVCNEPVTILVKLEDFYHAEPLSAIKSRVFNIGSLVREALLLETPMFAECNNGHCQKRQEIEHYLKPTHKDASLEEGYRPFVDLDI